MRGVLMTAAAVVIAGASAFAQGGRPASPAGIAAVEVKGAYAGGSYAGGKWIEISYSRPIKRGRDLWGSGAAYGKALLDGAPVWRAGANVSTRLKTDVPLVVSGKTLAPGEYSLFIDLKADGWTLIVSRWAAQQQYDPRNTNALWGAFGYTPDKDVVRAPMKLEVQPHATEQLTWEFLDVTGSGGALAIRWDRNLATVPFAFGS